MPNASDGAKRYLLSGLHQQQANELAAADNTRHASAVSAEVQLAATLRRVAEAEARAQRLEQQNALLKRVAYGISMERMALYDMIRDFAEKAGLQRPDYNDLKTNVARITADPDLRLQVWAETALEVDLGFAREGQKFLAEPTILSL